MRRCFAYTTTRSVSSGASTVRTTSFLDWRGASPGSWAVLATAAARRLSTATTGDQPSFGALSAAEAQARLPEFDLLLDVREPDEWAAGLIGNAKTITLGRMMRDVGTDELQSLKDKNLLVYCRSGARSAVACGVLAKNGFRVTNLAGGFRGWSQASANNNNKP